MRATTAGFAAELRIPLKWPLILLMITGWILLVGVNPLFSGTAQLTIVLACLLVQALGPVAWWLEKRGRQAGRWITIALSVALVFLAHRGWDWSGILALLALPPILTAALLGFPAVAITAVSETLILSAGLLQGNQDLAAVLTALAAIWITVGVLQALGHPVQQVTGWAWQYYQQAQALLEENGKRTAALQQVLDDLSHANAQLTRWNVVAQELRQVAEDARIAKEQFVANVSHELRTPLNMVIGFSEMILGAPEIYGSRLPQALLADLEVIRRNADHLSDLINDVLDLSRIESDQMALTKEYVALPEVVEEAVTAVRPLFETKGLYLRTEAPGHLPPVLCDRTRIREVLLNLLSNAGRFTEAGGVEVRIWADGNDVITAIRDTGPGISPAGLTKIFQPFQQLDGTIRRRYGGTGLGLSISKRFIDLHGGKIWAESWEGKGTTFFFRLPWKLFVPLTGDGTRWLVPEWEFRQRTQPYMAAKVVVRPRYLVVDQGDSFLRLLARHLPDAEIAAVASLEEAQQDLSKQPAQALLINAASVSQELDVFNASAILPEGTPALICSIPGAQDASTDLGASEVLVKPISREALLGTLDRLRLREGTVLIVDDEPDALQLFGRMLNSSGRNYRILLARDGQEALDVIRDRLPDVILLDLVMPNLDGFQLLEIRRHSPALRSVPVVVTAARDLSGRPIVSAALAITRRGGLSMHDLLSSIEAISKHPAAPPLRDPMPPTNQHA